VTAPFDRKEWIRRMRALNRSARGVFEISVYSREQIRDAVIAATYGERSALEVTEVMGRWGYEANRTKAGEGALCLGCDTEFRPLSSDAPAGFLIIMPFADRSMAITTGICVRCFACEDLDDVIIQQLKTIWPEAHRLPRSGSA
jgi:hypothetical protein